jgi:hypothetical protein
MEYEAATLILAERDGAYAERNMLVAFLTACYPSHLMRHPDGEEWDDDWRWIVCVHTTHGQMTWHIHDRELEQFAHLLRRANDWDGHTTEDKYARLRVMTTALSQDTRGWMAHLGGF